MQAKAQPDLVQSGGTVSITLDTTESGETYIESVHTDIPGLQVLVYRQDMRRNARFEGIALGDLLYNRVPVFTPELGRMISDIRAEMMEEGI